MRLSVQNRKAKLDIEKDSASSVRAIRAGQVLQIKSGQDLLAQGKYEAE
jgi:hypothetical protein